jgi:hypothetical protein
MSADPCPGSTYLTAGAYWHATPVKCVRCHTYSRVSVWIGTGHSCRRCEARARAERKP